MFLRSFTQAQRILIKAQFPKCVEMLLAILSCSSSGTRHGTPEFGSRLMKSLGVSANPEFR